MSMQEKEYYLELYKKEIELLFNAKLEESKNFDKYTFAISSVALALSLTLLQKLFYNPKYLCFIILSWIFLCAASLISLFSFYWSQKAIDSQYEILYKYIDNLLKDKETTILENKYTQQVDFLNILSFIFLCLGIVCILIFSIINLTKGGG